jgi:nitrate reductase molybdenum cofactor assembly chaperone
MEFDALARLLCYPGDGYRKDVEACAGMDPLLTEFAAKIQTLSVSDLQELYTQTFDINPVATLEVGWHLYGENYERGRFLVRMRQELRARGLPESTELPDHLTHVLAVLGRMEPAEAAEFCAASVLPAVGKMAAGLEGKDNPFEHVLRAIRRTLERIPQGVGA